MTILRNYLVPAALAVAVAFPAGAFAQQAAQPPAGAPMQQGQWQGHRGHHRGGMMRMFKDLNLTDQQKAQLKQIRQQFRQSHPEGQRPDPQAMQQLRQQMMNVLTPQQREKLQTEMQQMRQNRARHNGGNDGFGNPQPQSTPQP